MSAPVLVIGGRPQTLEFARALGVPAVNIQHPALVGPHDHGPDVVTVYLDYTDETSLTRVARGLHAEYGFKTAFSLTEPGSVPAARARSELGLSGHGVRVAEALQDKVRMRACIQGTPGLVDVGYASISTPADARRFAAECGYPFILKPVSGTASIGVHAVRGPSDVESVIGLLEQLRDDQERRFRDFFPLERFMAEQFVEGPEFSVECFSFAGRHVVLGVTEKITTGDFVEAGHVFPARHGRDVTTSIAQGAVALLDAIGITDGPSHTELKLTPQGPAVIESHDRVGGDRIFELVRLATGFDPEEATVAWAAGLIEPSVATVSADKAAATSFVFSGSGVVQSITDPAVILAMPYVEACHLETSVGGQVAAGNGNWDRVGQVICVAPDSRAAAAAAEAAASAIDIVLKESAS